ncbi:ATP-dependent DNA helicase RecG [Coralliovum pocilloporae]|uniref:ATP-dependent DNA helicase RecG n=1 Tax=Coralliovum pocilloporae TaxID=3066369 RepID=UPI00330766A2
MRPDLLNDLFRPISVLQGVGPKIELTLSKLLLGQEASGPATLIDLMLHMPSGLVDRRRQPGIAQAPHNSIVTLKVRIDRHQPTPRHLPRVPYKVSAHDETGEITLVFFHAKQSWLERSLPVGETRYVSSRVEWFNGAPQMVHPDHMVTEEEFHALPLIEPVYPLTKGISGKVLGKAIRAALESVPDFPEWQDQAWLQRNGALSFAAALAHLHRPEDANDLDPGSAAWKRLAYDEYLASQLALGLVRQTMRVTRGKIRRFEGHIKNKILAALPFSLTGSQSETIQEIEADLASDRKMIRLVQGDVGSGKTMVALMAMAAVVESGSQAALMAPTELLARQHMRSLEPLCEAAGLSVAVLTGREKGSARTRILNQLEKGELDILIGTHAVFQSDVAFRDLGLAVVDEQHRFGVHQRLALSNKGQDSDLLVMTATPIPRTLVLTYFGDMDVSKLMEKPAGRLPIETRTVSLDRVEEVMHRVARAVAEGAKIYWVCPLVEESELIDLTSAEDRFAALQPLLGDQVGLVHGRMKAQQKDEEMRRFQTGDIRVLVSTTVIEVGVDVPDATIMVIEHAERFGLAQLHQLRGRVGRGSASSTCLLLYKTPLGEVSQARLSVMRETEDGFRIAEEDLKLRGEGDVLGIRQSGMPGFRMALAEFHGELMEAARDDARLILMKDPSLESERGKALRMLLYLFRRDETIRLLHSG